MPVLPRRRDEIGEPVEELKRRELDDAVCRRLRGLSAAAGPDPVGGFVSGQHVADAGCAAVCDPVALAVTPIRRIRARAGRHCRRVDLGYPAAAIHSGFSADERRQIRDRLAAGGLRCMRTCCECGLRQRTKRTEVIPSTLFPQHEDRLVALHHESLDVIKPGLQKVSDLTSRGVSEADLNDLWGMASH